MSSKNQKVNEVNEVNLDHQDQVKNQENSIDPQADQNESLNDHLHLDDIIDENGNVLAFLNRNRVDDHLDHNPDHKVSCYSCCRTYLASEIKNYTDGGWTIICPYCMVDAVLDNELPLEELKKMNEEMFSTSFFYDEDEKVKTPEEIKAEEDALIENLNKSVDELDISVWFQNCLNNANIKYIGELVQKSEDDILQMMKFQTKRDTNDQLKELKELLSDLRLTLGMQLDSWTAPN